MARFRRTLSPSKDDLRVTGHLFLQRGDRHEFGPACGVFILSAAPATAAPQNRPAKPDLGTSQPTVSQDAPAPTTGRIRGRVVRADTGAPLFGAQIALERDSRGFRRATTDEEGRYEFAELPAGRFLLNAAQGGYVTLQYGQRRAFETGRPLMLAGAQLLEKIDFALPRGGVIVGRVTDESGEPVTGAQIRAERYEYRPGGQRQLATVSLGAAINPFALTTNDRGEFRVFGLPPGDYLAAHGCNRRDCRDGSAPHKRSSGGRLQIITSPADRRAPFFADATVFDSNGDGTVREDDSFRIAGIFGRILFAPVGAPPQWMLKAVMVDGDDVTSAGTDAAHLAAGARLRVVLTDNVTELSGSVRDASNKSMTDYVVVVLPDSNVEPVESAVAARYTRTARPDRSGTFRIRALPPGRYMAAAVEALEQGSEWNPVFQAAVRPGARHFESIEGQTLTLDLKLTP